MQRPRFNDLALPHLNAAYNLARYLVRDVSHAEDIVQDAYERALSAFDNFRGGDARAWLLTIVRNCCMTWLSKHAQEQQRLSESTTQSDTEQSVLDSSTPESVTLRDEESTMLRKCIATLPPAMREVLVLREFEDISYREIAIIVDAPIGTVMSRLARARSLLAAQYQRSRMSEANP